MPASWLRSSRRSTPTDCSKSLGMVPGLAPGPVIGEPEEPEENNRLGMARFLRRLIKTRRRGLEIGFLY